MLATLLAAGMLFGPVECDRAWQERNVLTRELGAILRREVRRGTSTEAELRRIEAIQRRRAELLRPECASVGS